MASEDLSSQIPSLPEGSSAHQAFLAVHQVADDERMVDVRKQSIADLRQTEVNLLEQLQLTAERREEEIRDLEAFSAEIAERRKHTFVQVMDVLRPIGWDDARLQDAAGKIIGGDWRLFTETVRAIKEMQGPSVDFGIQKRAIAIPAVTEREILRPHDVVRLHRLASHLAYMQQLDEVPQEFAYSPSDHHLGFRGLVARRALPSKAADALSMIYSSPSYHKRSPSSRDVLHRMHDLSSFTQKTILEQTGVTGGAMHLFPLKDIRWLIRRDMPEVLAIERTAFDPEGAWGEDDFLYHLRQRNTIGMVAEENNEILGFMVYELHKEIINVLNLAVRDDHQREGVGESLVMKLQGKLSQQRRRMLRMNVPDSCSVGQMYLSACGFTALGSTEGTGKDPWGSGVKMQMPVLEANVHRVRDAREWLALADAFLTSAA
jgi:ribosomal-protein-alanine N-acetyltransferase